MLHIKSIYILFFVQNEQLYQITEDIELISSCIINCTLCYVFLSRNELRIEEGLSDLKK